jgi:hypothetical protein
VSPCARTAHGCKRRSRGTRHGPRYVILSEAKNLAFRPRNSEILRFAQNDNHEDVFRRSQ